MEDLILKVLEETTIDAGIHRDEIVVKVQGLEPETGKLDILRAIIDLHQIGAIKTTMDSLITFYAT